MEQKFCTACGAALSEGRNFCEHCGSPVLPDSGVPAPHPAAPAGPSAGIPPFMAQPEGGSGRKTAVIIAIIFLVLVVITAAFLSVLPGRSGTEASRGIVPAQVTTPEAATSVAAASFPLTTVTTGTPTRKPDPFPDVLRLKDKLLFGSEAVASEATVYRYWINDTYQWHNDMDNHYYVQEPGTGNKYLFVFVHLQNIGNTRVWFPPAGNVMVYYNGATYTQDQNHFRPDKSGDAEARPLEIKEIQYFQKLNGDEYAEDFGYSHGTELAFLYPGGSNAVDGYIVYEVPQALIPEETYVTIPFNGQDSGVWKLG